MLLGWNFTYLSPNNIFCMILKCGRFLYVRSLLSTFVFFLVTAAVRKIFCKLYVSVVNFAFA